MTFLLLLRCLFIYVPLLLIYVPHFSPSHEVKYRFASLVKGKRNPFGRINPEQKNMLNFSTNV